MPPAFRNHRAPTGADIPAANAASSLVIPFAIPDQNRWSSVRPANGGRPGDGNGARPDCADRLFPLTIATSFVRVLRRSFEYKQYTSIAFGLRCKEAGVRPSMGSVGDAYDNAMCESFFATLECELFDRRKFRTKAEARMAVFAFIEGWYNPGRRHSALGYQSPVNYERSAQERLESASA
jgi:hypothetical protein